MESLKCLLEFLETVILNFILMSICNNQRRTNDAFNIKTGEEGKT